MFSGGGLDVYVYRSGVVELRRPLELPDGQYEFREAYYNGNFAEMTADPAAHVFERVWVYAVSVNGVSVWREA